MRYEDFRPDSRRLWKVANGLLEQAITGYAQ